MRSQRQIFTLIAAAGSAGAFLHHPSASHHHAAASSSSLIAEPFGDGRAVTSLGVGIRSIRSPYWQVFNRAEAPAQNGVGHVIDRDYTVASVLLCVGLWLGLFGPSESQFIDGLGAAFHLWFGCFVGMQTMKTRVVFNRGTFELNTVTNSVLGLEADKGLKPKECKNYVLGTNNEWRYDSFVNWEFFPSIDFPILIYFKETQTPPEMQIKGSLGGRQMDRRNNGQMHFFPAFANVRQVREQFEAHGCKKIGPVNGEEYKMRV